jgi:uncharacterized membrane protein
MMKKKSRFLVRTLVVFSLLIGLSQGLIVQAQTPSVLPDQIQTEPQQDFFKAKIIEVHNEEEQVGLNGIKTYIQNFKLQGLEGAWKNKEITIEKSEFNVIGPNAYKKNDVLLISHSKDAGGEDFFAVIDYGRDSSLYFLIVLFAGLVLLMGRAKGLKALISLVFSFVVIIFLIIPQILGGANPVLVSAGGGILIILFSLYLTYGLKPFTHLAAFSMGASLIITVLLSDLFTGLTKLTGTSDEQITYLSQMLGHPLNTRGLLLAGFIIGALGVLDDVVINQISIIEELHKVDRSLTYRQLLQKGLKIGIDHISAIVNSLFLAYVGTSLPLLLLFIADSGAPLSFSQTLDIELIAVEVVRTLSGSIGLLLAVPIATFAAAVYISRKKSHRSMFEHQGIPGQTRR